MYLLLSVSILTSSFYYQMIMFMVILVIVRVFLFGPLFDNFIDVTIINVTAVAVLEV